jgi:pyruvate-formate lyase-activating enzyme
MNTFKLQLDENIKYDIKKLESQLYKNLNMNLDEPIENNILSYDGCNIQLISNVLIIRTNYIYGDKYGKYITTINSKILNEIELWTKDSYLNNKKEVKN